MNNNYFNSNWKNSQDNQAIAERLGVEYIRVRDYLLPNIALSENEDAPPLGKYDMMHKAYLKQHKSALYSQLLVSERLCPPCREIDEAVATRLKAIPDREAAQYIILSELVCAQPLFTTFNPPQNLARGITALLPTDRKVGTRNLTLKSLSPAEELSENCAASALLFFAL